MREKRLLLFRQVALGRMTIAFPGAETPCYCSPLAWTGSNSDPFTMDKQNIFPKQFILHYSMTNTQTKM